MLAASADPRTLDRCSSASTTYSSRCPPGRSNARGFFVGVLGMTEVEKPLVLADRGGAWFRAGGLEVHLGVEADFRPARKAHPGIVVEDLDEVARRVATTGQDVRWDATSRATGASPRTTRSATAWSSCRRSDHAPDRHGRPDLVDPSRSHHREDTARAVGGPAFPASVMEVP